MFKNSLMTEADCSERWGISYAHIHAKYYVTSRILGTFHCEYMSWSVFESLKYLSPVNSCVGICLHSFRTYLTSSAASVFRFFPFFRIPLMQVPAFLGELGAGLSGSVGRSGGNHSGTNFPVSYSISDYGSMLIGSVVQICL